MNTPVDFCFLTPDGVPIADARVEIQLSRSSFDDEDTGVLMPRLIEVQTNAKGEVTVALATAKVPYFVTVEDPVSEASLYYEFIVPEVQNPVTHVRLQDIVIDGPISGKPYDEAALALIQDAKVHSMASMVAAQEAANTATNSVASVLEARDEALKVLPSTSEAPPLKPMANQQWIHASTGKKYTWLYNPASLHGAWVETEASLVLNPPEATKTPDGDGFDPAALPVLVNVANLNTTILVEEAGTAYRIPLSNIGTSVSEMDYAGQLTAADIITVIQADGAEKRTTIGALAAAISRINSN